MQDDDWRHGEPDRVGVVLQSEGQQLAADVRRYRHLGGSWRRQRMQGQGVQEVTGGRILAVIETTIMAACSIAGVTQGHVAGIVSAGVDFGSGLGGPAHFFVKAMVIAQGIPERAAGRDGCC